MAKPCNSATEFPFSKGTITIDCKKPEEHVGQHEGQFKCSTRDMDMPKENQSGQSDFIVNTFDLKVFWM